MLTESLIKFGMKPHVKIYMKFFDYGMQDFIPCEICESRAVDIHHINGRGKGKDVIQNLMGLCRVCHNKAENETMTPAEFQFTHLKFIEQYQLKPKQ